MDGIKETDTLTPIDRYPDSPTHGRALLPIIPLLDAPGTANVMTALQTGKHLSGSLLPYTEVTIEGYHPLGAALWALVHARQGRRLQEGWVNVMLLENAGRVFLEAMEKV